MADIISFDEKVRDTKEKDVDRIRERKMRTLRQVLHSRAPDICERCHIQLPSKNMPADQQLRVPYRFCEGCSEEYVDYIERLQGKAKADHYWQNDVWLETWRRWIDFRSVMDRYSKTKAFTRLVRELQSPPTPE